MSKQKWPSGATVYADRTPEGRIRVEDKWAEDSEGNAVFHIDIAGRDWREAIMAILSEANVGHDVSDKIYDLLSPPAPPKNPVTAAELGFPSGHISLPTTFVRLDLKETGED